MRELDIFAPLLAGTTVIEAAAGTGKTYAIAALFLRLILEREMTVESLLVVTFTDAATEELRDRVRDRLSRALDAFSGLKPADDFLAELLRRNPDRQRARELLTLALASFDGASIHTIHGFCSRVLQEHAFECGTLFDTELVTDQSKIVREIAEDAWRRFFYQADDLFVAHVIRSGVTLEELADILKLSSSRIELSIIPDASPIAVDQALESCQKAFHRLQEAWPLARESVVAILSDSSALNRTSYKPASIEGWACSMDRFASGRDPLDIPGKLEKFTLSAVAAATKKGMTTPEHRFFSICESFNHAAAELQRQFGINILAMKGELARTAHSELSRRKELRNLRSYDDLLFALHTVLNSGSRDLLVQGLRRRYQAALIDEFQDTDKLQYSIFTELFAGAEAPLVLIGDPKQAIYSFRGADLSAYLSAVRGSLEDGFTLTRNWRSTPEFLAAVNALFQGSRPFVIPEIEYRPVSSGKYPEGSGPFAAEPPLVLWRYDRNGGALQQNPLAKSKAELLVARDVSLEVARLIGAGEKVDAGDIAVLVRKNHQGRLVQRALRDMGIPSVLHGTESLFCSREIMELHRLLVAVADPGNEPRLRSALATELLGWSAARLDAVKEDTAEWSLVLERFCGLHDSWTEQGFMSMAAELLAVEAVRPRLLAYPDGERRLTNLLHSLEVLHHASLEEELGMEGLLTWLSERIAVPPEIDEYQLRLETDESCVQLVTIHRSKGLEYPVVFVPFAWEGVRKECTAIFHDRERLIFDLGSPGIAESRRRAREEQFAEDLRLLYVAITRAKFRCYLTCGLFSGSETSALAYLLHRPLLAEGDPVELLASHLLTLDSAAREQDIQALVERSGSAIAVLSPPQDHDLPAPTAVIERSSIKYRPFQGEIDRTWRVTSFTGLISGKGHASELPDRDATTEVSAPLADDSEAVPNGIFAFPRGAQPGTCLHAILERIDFARFNRDEVRELAVDQLKRHGIATDWGETVAGMVENVLHTPLLVNNDGFSLARLEPGSWRQEMEFMLPLATLQSTDLPRLFRSHGNEARFPALLEELGFTQVRGMLLGFIDMVFRYNGRYYLIDWKSNHLGNRPVDYTSDRLTVVMEREFYILQYHLYTVALHRFLALRQPGYNYDLHFGGVFYLFLRGIHPALGPASGIFHHRPERCFVEELTRTICNPQGGILGA